MLYQLSYFPKIDVKNSTIFREQLQAIFKKFAKGKRVAGTF